MKRQIVNESRKEYKVHCHFLYQAIHNAKTRIILAYDSMIDLLCQTEKLFPNKLIEQAVSKKYNLYITGTY
jgi:hypothetical protein